MSTTLDADYHGRLIALAGLTDISSDQLGRLLQRHGLDSLWRLLVGGHRVSTRDRKAAADGEQLAFLPDDRMRAWGAQLRAARPHELCVQHQRHGVHVVSVLDEAFPSALTKWRDAPGVLFVRGDQSLLHQPTRRVGIVGTRKATSYGKQVARSFGRTLSAHGVSVVSGLASGIDGSAHVGVLHDRRPTDAGPIAVVGSGLDRVYPNVNRELWAEVAKSGALVSEWPLGAAPIAWHFPARNRLIVALSEAIVVVESADKGGSMLTVNQASSRQVPVLAVPGPITSTVSAGTNNLLGGAGVSACLGAIDVLRQLNLTDDTAGVLHCPPDTRRPPDGDGTALLQVLGWDVWTIDRLMSKIPGIESGMLLLTLHELEFDGWVTRGSDGWFQLAPRG
jgi:DNA processing protein